MNAQTLFEALQAIPDHRTKKGRRFELATILVIALAAMLSGVNDLLAIARWGRRLSPKALWALGASKKRRKAPCHATYHYVFQDVSPADLRAALGVLVNLEGGLGHVAIDGKRIRGSQHEDSPGIHMLHAFSNRLRAAVGSLAVPPDSGECIEALELIKSLPLDGCLVSGDAAFTTSPIAKAIRDRGGHYFLFVVMPEACGARRQPTGVAIRAPAGVRRRFPLSRSYRRNQDYPSKSGVIHRT